MSSLRNKFEDSYVKGNFQQDNVYIRNLCFSAKTRAALLLSLLLFIITYCQLYGAAVFYMLEETIDPNGDNVKFYFHDTLLVDLFPSEELNKSYQLSEVGSLKARYAAAEQVYRSTVNARHTWIKSLHANKLSNIPEWNDKSGTHLWNYFPPTFNCPFHVERVGKLGEGGIWVCGMELFEKEPRPQECVIYLFGKGNEEYLVQRLVNRTDCHIFGFSTEGGKAVKLKHLNFHFNDKVKVWEKDESKEKQTLATIMVENGHGWVDLLIMDIEGRELSVLEQIMKDHEEVLPFGQLVMEIHVPSPTEANKKTDKKAGKFEEFIKWFEQLESRGLRPFYSEQSFTLRYAKLKSGKNVTAKESPNPNLQMQYSFLNLRGKHIFLTGK